MATINPSEPKFPDERRPRTYDDPNAPWQIWPLALLGAGIIIVLAMVARVALRRGFDGLRASHRKTGSRSGGTRSSMLRAFPGVLLMRPSCSSLSTIW